MKPFNRERFLLYLLAGLLGWQATIFSFGVVLCSRVTPLAEISTVCPELGNRFDKFVQTTLGAVLGLLAGAAALSTNQKKPSTSDPVSPLPSSQEPAQSTVQRPVQESVRARNSGKGS